MDDGLKVLNSSWQGVFSSAFSPLLPVCFLPLLLGSLLSNEQVFPAMARLPLARGFIITPLHLQFVLFMRYLSDVFRNHC